MFMKTGDAETILTVVKDTDDDSQRENVLAGALEQAKQYYAEKTIEDKTES